MKLDESIELINKTKKLNEMDNLTNLSVSEMRSCMNEMMADENKSGCLYEILTQEGFLPETLAEGEDYGTHCETMMEDDMITQEMYKACTMSESECGCKVQEWLNEKLIGNQKKLDKNHNGKIDADDFALMHKDGAVDEYNKSTMKSFTHQYGKEKGKNIYYATANKQNRNPETFEKNEQIAEGEEGGSRYMFFSNLELIKHHVEEMLNMDSVTIESILENGHDWAGDHIATAKESIDQVYDFLTGEIEIPESEPESEPESGLAVMGGETPINENSQEDEEDEDEDSPSYLEQKQKMLNKMINKFSKYVANFIPMVDKLNSETMNQYFETELRDIGEYSSNSFKEFLTKNENETDIEYYERLTNLNSGYSSIFNNLVEPRKRGYFTKHGDKLGLQTLEIIEDVLTDIFDSKNDIYSKKAEVERIENGIKDRESREDTNDDFETESDKVTKLKKGVDSVLKADALDFIDDDDDENLYENNLPNFKPIIGKNVQSTNKSDSEKAEKEELEDVEDSQETTEEKVDNLKNQKFANNPNMESEFEKEVREKKQLGAFNALNLDFQNDVPKSYKDRVELEVTTGHSRKRDEAKLGKEANVDHEATKKTGEKMIAASKANQGERDDFYKPNPILATSNLYQQTSITGKEKGGKKNPGGGDLNESELADIRKMKKMFGYEQKLITENKTPKELNENEILLKNISKKKFI